MSAYIVVAFVTKQGMDTIIVVLAIAPHIGRFMCEAQDAFHSLIK